MKWNIFKKYLPDEVVLRKISVLTCAYDNDIISEQEYTYELAELMEKANTSLLIKLSV